MAVTAALMSATPSRLRYLLTQDGAAGTTVNITSSGAATPDLLTDSANTNGPIRALARVATDGYGPIAAGTAITAALASMLWESNHAAATGGSVPGAVPGLKTAKMTLTVRSGAAPEWRVLANAAANLANILVTAQAGAGTAILDIVVDNDRGG